MSRTDIDIKFSDETIFAGLDRLLLLGFDCVVRISILITFVNWRLESLSQVPKVPCFVDFRREGEIFGIFLRNTSFLLFLDQDLELLVDHIDYDRSSFFGKSVFYTEVLCDDFWVIVKFTFDFLFSHGT